MPRSCREQYAGYVVLFPLITLFIAAVSAGCNSASSNQGNLDEYFLKGVATAEATNLPVYWLGQGFTAGNLAFYGPYGADLGESGEGEIGVNYIAPLDGTDNVVESANTGLVLTTYSQTNWAPVRDWLMTSKLRNSTRHQVRVGANDATMVVEGYSTRAVNAVYLVLQLDNVVVVADAHSGGPISPGGPDYSPFVNDPDLLIQVMQDLRPYPQ